MGKALNLECGGWLGADYEESDQVRPVLTEKRYGDWHGSCVCCGQLAELS
jgi:hypothetical protein